MGGPMNVYGSKRVHCTLPKGWWMIACYLICGTPYLVLSVA